MTIAREFELVVQRENISGGNNRLEFGIRALGAIRPLEHLEFSILICLFTISFYCKNIYTHVRG